MSVTIRLDDKFREEKVPSSHSGDLTDAEAICFEIAHELLMEMEGNRYESHEVMSTMQEYGLMLQRRLNGTKVESYLQNLDVDYPNIGFNNGQENKMLILAVIQR